MDENLEVLSEEIKQLENKLVELKKEYKEKKTEKLRIAIEARNEADKAVKEELKNLGYTYSAKIIDNDFWRGRAF